MSVPEVATELFGDRLSLTVGYRDWLADTAVTRGLIGPREADRLWDRHILNCAVVAALFQPDERVVDIGSGAGLPGIPIAIARPDLDVVLVEPLLRRTTFLDEVVEDLGLTNVTVVRGRAEEKAIIAEHGEADAVTSRAVAPLDRLVRWSAPLIRAEGRLVAMKGSSAGTEIEEHRSACGSHGITDLRVETVGGDRLAEATTLVVGRKTAESSARARRRKRRTESERSV
ncbi:16S rRNA (guanine(527)-N(7))-methyltransferase RsmG [Gordonia sp. X0973]|uniref:16S rRNA (guanine(527)-N(7))-methyltransferase RsmG n=1 Tax=Gordonia sp. X0973 TaxID=2742602 RepID=UPI000F54A232|nr:16S rRNA (guanine(527)-N(7))-methyltransferase RsmG [Gordonia sp. X0973]QKT08936.1 16S rRNA (guanine(527)-N(7))-methyltransferase RsmG [Gordonia sp. X0973]